ncbi:MAG TPA: hypothetical protein VFV54_00995, partial [Thermoanaerobaculia bacterium]|nr:hypothetical protein [Thermoanaerobaculia bacterium]
MRKTAAFVLALVAILSVARPAPAQAPADRFSERAFVTAIDMIVEVSDARGRTPADLTPADFQLLEDGVERTIISLEYLDPATGHSSKSETASDAARPVWQVVVWFDAMTMSRSTLATAGRELAKRAPALLAFGPVTVVYADISAELIVDSTRDPQKLALAIETIMRRPPGDRISRLRREFIEALDAIKETDLLGERVTVGAVDRAIPPYVAEEDRLLQIGRKNMTRWLAKAPRRTPRMLVYVGDGFDLDPAQFYLQMLQTSGDATIDVGQTRADSQTRAKVAGDELAQTLALGGWTALTIGGVNVYSTSDVTRGTGRRFSGKQSGVAPPFFFMKPDEPLVHLAEVTGGERIAHPAALSTALADIGRRIRITYQVDREPDPRPRRVEIVPLRAGLTVRGAEWTASTTTEGVAGGRAIDLLTGEGARGDLGVTAALVPSPDDPASRSIEARIDFAPMGQAASQIAATKVRMTVAVEIEGAPPEVFHRVIDIDDFAARRGLVWSAPMRLPARARAIAVIAEELTTGWWGGARVGDPPAVATKPAAVAPTPAPAPPSAQGVADRAEAFARAIAERKLVLALEWDAACTACDEIEATVISHPEIGRLAKSFVLLGPSPSPADPRVALYDPSGRLVLFWPAIPAGRKGQLSTGELSAIMQKAEAGAPYFLRAHDAFAAGAVADAHLADGLAYRQAAEPARA